ncbi:MAG: flippase-like domain-containing protein [Bacteroidales bacterium]|nr:flippase-like domain-containing protein [Bacteroidales bacterium]
MKVHPTLKKIIKIVLVIAFYVGLYLLTKEHFEQFGALTTDNIQVSWFPLVLALLLVAPNWLLEAVKWRISLSPVEKVSFGVSFVGILKGITPSLFTPNRVGEAFGRPSVLQHGHRFSGGMATAYCGFSQMPVMMLMGVLSCMYFMWREVEISHSTFLTTWWFVALGFACTIAVGVLYMYPKYTIPFVRNSEKSSGIRRKLNFFCHYTYKERLQLMFFSLIRFFVYSLQNYLTIIGLGIEINFPDGMMSVFLIYALMSFVPRPALAELGVRCSASVMVLKEYTMDFRLPTISSIILWTINLLLPAICGGVFYLIRKKERVDEKKVDEKFCDVENVT